MKKTFFLIFFLTLVISVNAQLQTINNGETGLQVRTKLNDMFSDLFDNIINIQFSTDGSTDWHETYTGADNYYRITRDLGVTWSNAIPINTGIVIQFSADSLLWSYSFTTGDDYIRYSSDNGSTWTNAISISNTVESDPVYAGDSADIVQYSDTASIIETKVNAASTYEPILTKGNLTENVTGLEFDNTRQVIGGAAQLSLSSGYVIPTTTDTTRWGQSSGSMVYPGAGIPLSTGSAWGTSITNNSSNWNTAYGWGNHASAGYLTSESQSLSDVLGVGATTNNQTLLFDYNGGVAAQFKFGTYSYKIEEIGGGNDLSFSYGTYGSAHTEAFRIQDNGSVFADKFKVGFNSNDEIGSIKINGADSTFLGYNGTAWVRLDSLGGGSGSGDMTKAIYDADENNVIDVIRGGTGQSGYTVGDILYASTTVALSKLNAGTSGYVLTSNGAGAAPSWQASATGYWESGTNGIEYTDGTKNVGIRTAAASTAMLKVADATGISGGYALWVDNYHSAGHGALIQGGNGSSEYALRVQQRSADGAELFNVRGDGKLYAPLLGSATSDTVLYLNSGLITKGLAPSGSSSPWTDNGTTLSPSDDEDLLLSGSSANNLIFYDTSYSYRYKFGASAGGNMDIGYSTNGVDYTSLIQGFGTSGNVNVVGNLGIGVTSPSFKVDAAGKIQGYGIMDATAATQSVSSNTTINTDNAGSSETITLGGNLTLSLHNIDDGQFGEILVKQDATGSRVLAIATFSDAGSTGLTEVYSGGLSNINSVGNSYSAIKYKRLGTIVLIDILYYE